MLKTLKFYSFLMIATLAVNLANAQHHTNSPYSRYGIGEIFSKGFGQNRAMGGTAIGLNSATNLNITNPASYNAIPQQSITFEVGLSSKQSQFSTDDWNYNAENSNISYLALGFPITKWLKGSLGIIPYSTVGYSVMNHTSIPKDGFIVGDATTLYEGEGGIYSAYFGNSIKLPYNFYLGYNINYMFGTLDHTKSTEFLDYNDRTALVTETHDRINDFYYNLGLQYTNKIKLKKDNKLLFYTIGLIFDNERKISAMRTTKTDRMLYVNSLSRTNEILNDTLNDGNIVLPQNIGIGFSLLSKHFLFAFDYAQQDWSKAKFFDKTDVNLTKSNKFAIGMGYTPDPNSTNYWKARQYRIGGHYENTYLQMMDKNGNYQQVVDYGLSLGMDFYWRSTKTDYNLFNLAIELGKRGTTDSGLLEEKYVNFHINFSLHSLWFMKYKFQ